MFIAHSYIIKHDLVTSNQVFQYLYMLKLDKKAYLKYTSLFKIHLQNCFAQRIGFVFSFDSLLNKKLLYLNNDVLETFGL